MAKPSTKSAIKGKREAEDDLEKQVNAKKQKKDLNIEQAVKAKLGAKIAKKKKDESSSSDSEEEQKIKKVVAKRAPTKDSSSEDSSSDDSSSDDEPAAAKKPSVAEKNGSVAKKGKVAGSSSSSEDDSSSDEEPPAVKKQATSKKQQSSSSSEEESSSDEEPAKKQPVSAKNSSVTATVKNGKPASTSEDSSSEDESSDEEPAAKNKQPAVVKKTKPASSPDSSDEESDDDESSGDSEDDEESEDEKVTPKKKDTDTEMVDASAGTKTKQPKTPVTPQAQEGSKTLFVGNLAFAVEKADVENFFKSAGEVVDVRLVTADDGSFKGYGYVEFASAEDAQKALDLNGQPLLGRELRLDLAHERGPRTPYSGKASNTFQSGGNGQNQTVFVKGFDSSLGEDQVRNALQEHFGSCGEVTRVSVPTDRETGAIKGIAYMDLQDGEAFKKALELNGSDMGGYYLTVNEAKPRGDSRDGFGGRSGGRSSGGRGGRGRSGGRDGGGRFGGRGGGGRFGGRGGGGRGGFGSGGGFGGRGGRGTPNKPSITASAQGKKITFGDE